MGYKNSFFMLLLLSCMSSKCQYSAWQTKMPEEMKNLNRKNLERIKNRKIEGEMFKVAFIADSQRDPYTFEKVVEYINARSDAHQIAFMAILGDITDSGLMQEYNLIFNGIKDSTIPYFAVVGNHDAISKGKDIFLDMFGPYDFVIPYKWAKFVAYNNNGYEFKNLPNKEFLHGQSKWSNPKETYSHYVLLAHAPFLDRPKNTPELAYALGIETEAFKLEMSDYGYKHGVFGHHHEFHYEAKEDTQFMKVDKLEADKIHYGIIHVYKNRIEYFFCTPVCQPAS